MHTLMANIAHNPLRFDQGFGSELQTQMKNVKKLQTWWMCKWGLDKGVFIYNVL